MQQQDSWAGWGGVQGGAAVHCPRQSAVPKQTSRRRAPAVPPSRARRYAAPQSVAPPPTRPAVARWKGRKMQRTMRGCNEHGVVKFEPNPTAPARQQPGRYNQAQCRVHTCSRSRRSWRSVAATSAASPLSIAACGRGSGASEANPRGGTCCAWQDTGSRRQPKRTSQLPPPFRRSCLAALASSASDSRCARCAAVSACTTTWTAVCCGSTPSSWSTYLQCTGQDKQGRLSVQRRQAACSGQGGPPAQGAGRRAAGAAAAAAMQSAAAGRHSTGHERNERLAAHRQRRFFGKPITRPQPIALSKVDFPTPFLQRGCTSAGDPVAVQAAHV